MRTQKKEKKCQSCGTVMLIAPSRLADGRGKYCSRSCAKDGYNAMAKRPATRKNGNHRFEYQVAVEKALGRPLCKGEVVHHIDGNPQNNQNGNLVVCRQSYHLLLHARTKAFMATGNANSKKCTYCQKWDSPENMIPHKAGTSVMRHRSCYYGKEAAHDC